MANILCALHTFIYSIIKLVAFFLLSKYLFPLTVTLVKITPNQYIIIKNMPNQYIIIIMWEISSKNNRLYILQHSQHIYIHYSNLKLLFLNKANSRRRFLQDCYLQLRKLLKRNTTSGGVYLSYGELSDKI